MLRHLLVCAYNKNLCNISKGQQGQISYLNLLNSTSIVATPNLVPQGNNIQFLVAQQQTQLGSRMPTWGSPQQNAFYSGVAQTPVNTLANSNFNVPKNLSPSPTPTANIRQRQPRKQTSKKETKSSSPIPTIKDGQSQQEDEEEVSEGDETQSVLADDNSKLQTENGSGSDDDLDEEDEESGTAEKKRRRRRDKERPRKRLFMRERKYN